MTAAFGDKLCEVLFPSSIGGLVSLHCRQLHDVKSKSEIKNVRRIENVSATRHSKTSTKHGD